MTSNNPKADLLYEIVRYIFIVNGEPVPPSDSTIEETATQLEIINDRLQQRESSDDS